MKQLILPESYSGEELLTLSSADSHYLLKVQRRDIGYSLDLLNIDGEKFRGTIVDIADGLCILKLVKSFSRSENKRELILFQSIPKGKKIDLMIRQSVEIGVTSIVPIMAEHSIPTFKTDTDKVKKRERWSKIIKEASQQSGTAKITTLEPLQGFREALNGLPEPYTGIFFHQVPLENRSLHTLLANHEERIVLVIGPEGGLSAKEVDLLKEYGFKPALLGDNILRAETATTFALGAVQTIINEKESWQER